MLVLYICIQVRETKIEFEASNGTHKKCLLLSCCSLVGQKSGITKKFTIKIIAIKTTTSIKNKIANVTINKTFN
jgi:hypothetical protein